ncbi:MAG: hypothetical protein IPM29_17495 [Planctomycetes bacterium]|nr:hypothetical protein [Planctomycetota bacterium]
MTGKRKDRTAIDLCAAAQQRTRERIRASYRLFQRVDTALERSSRLSELAAWTLGAARGAWNHEAREPGDSPCLVFPHSAGRDALAIAATPRRADTG